MAAGRVQPTPGSGDDMILKFTMSGKLVMQFGHRGQSTGNPDTVNVHQPTDVFVRHADERALRRRRLRQSARRRLRSETGQVQAHVGRVRQPAAGDVRRERADAACAAMPMARRSSACRTRSRCRAMARLRCRSHEQPDSAVHTRREVSEAGARHDRGTTWPGAGRLRVLARSAAAVSLRRRFRPDAGRDLRSRRR